MKGFRSWILWHNDDYVLVNKPAGVASLHERSGSGEESLLEQARRFYPDPMLCHRLDRDTSGVLAIALNPVAYRHLAMQFEARTVEKIYHCIVEGALQFNAFDVDLPINTDDPLRIRIDRRNGKPARTIFDTLEVFRHFTLMQAKPFTGRMHQIRVHLASQNARIAGDLQYGGKQHFLSEIKRHVSGDDSPLMRRFALHARSLAFQLPDGTLQRTEAPYPRDMEVMLKLLRKYDLP